MTDLLHFPSSFFFFLKKTLLFSGRFGLGVVANSSPSWRSAHHRSSSTPRSLCSEKKKKKTKTGRELRIPEFCYTFFILRSYNNTCTAIGRPWSSNVLFRVHYRPHIYSICVHVHISFFKWFYKPFSDWPFAPKCAPENPPSSVPSSHWRGRRPAPAWPWLAPERSLNWPWKHTRDLCMTATIQESLQRAQCFLCRAHAE